MPHLKDEPVEMRRYAPSDREAVLRVAFETGFFGRSMAEILDNQRCFVRSLDWFLSSDGEHCFVAVRGGRIVGYAVASRGDVRLRAATMYVRHMVADLIRWPLMSPKERRYLAARLVAAARAARGEERRFRTPASSRLHINLLPEVRGGGIGSSMLQKLLTSLRSDGVEAVHANSYQSPRNDTRRFWEKNGFRETSRVRSRAWEAWCPGEEIFLVCYARPL